MELGFRIPIVKEIADSLSCIERIPKLRILMPQAKISRNSEFGFPNYGATVCLKVRYCVRKKKMVGNNQMSQMISNILLK